MSHDTNNTGNGDTARGSNAVHHEWEEPFHPSVTIVKAVAAATGRAPMDLPPLHKHVDPDALDTLMTDGEDAAVTVSFSYAGTVVVIEGSGSIEVRVDSYE